MLKLLPPLFRRQPLDNATQEVIFNLLACPDSRELLLENSAERLKEIGCAHRGVGVGSQEYYEQGCKVFTCEDGINDGRGWIICYKCNSVVGESSYGSHYLPSCHHCKGESKKGGWDLDPYTLQLITYALGVNYSTVERKLAAAINRRNLLRKVEINEQR